MTIRHSPATEADRARGEQGETLLELIVAVAIIGIGVVALLGTLFSVVFLTNRNRGDVETAVSATYILERIQESSYQSCAVSGSSTYDAFLSLATPRPTMTIEYLADRTSATPTFQASCPATDQGLQKVTLRVARGVGNERRIANLVLIKRDDRCPAGSASTTSTTTATASRC